MRVATNWCAVKTEECMCAYCMCHSLHHRNSPFREAAWVILDLRVLGRSPTSPIRDPRVTHFLDKIANAYVSPPIT